MPSRLALTVLILLGLLASAAPAYRSPTPSERAAIIAGLPKDSILHQSCVSYTIRVSTVDPHYALVGFGFPLHPSQTCHEFNGASIMRRQPTGRWKQVAAGSEFDCDGIVPERIMRDLVKYCMYGESSHFYSPSRNIECVLRNHGTALACVTFNNGISAYLYRSARVQVRPAPPASFFQPASAAATVIPYGSYWNCGSSGCSGLKPFECESLTSGMKCDVLDINGPSHGFTIARAGVRTF